MITTKLQISEPDYYSCQLTERFPIKVTLIAINGNTGFGINESLDSNEDTLQSYISELQKNPSVINVDITYKSSFLCWTRLVHKLEKPSIYELHPANFSTTRIYSVFNDNYRIIHR